jgi:Fe-S-cluster containining protein
MQGLDRLVKDRAEGRYADNPRHCEDVDFMAEHWTPVPGQPGRYSCDQYDSEARACRAQESKPPVCRDYPWYLEGPSALRAGALDPQCSYLLDVPPAARPAGARPLIPIEVIR